MKVQYTVCYLTVQLAAPHIIRHITPTYAFIKIDKYAHIDRN